MSWEQSPTFSSDVETTVTGEYIVMNHKYSEVTVKQFTFQIQASVSVHLVLQGLFIQFGALKRSELEFIRKSKKKKLFSSPRFNPLKTRRCKSIQHSSDWSSLSHDEIVPSWWERDRSGWLVTLLWTPMRDFRQRARESLHQYQWREYLLEGCWW